MLTNFTRTNIFWNKFTFDKKLPPESDGEKKQFKWGDLFATTCENIRDTAQDAAKKGVDMLKNEMDTSSRLSVNQNAPATENFTSFVEDSDPKNAESFYNIF